MIIYFWTMRNKDELKKEAIIRATVKLVNEIGFVSSSVSKIAKEANVSPATIYIYYKNKEDLLTSVYVDIKLKMGQRLLEKFDPSEPFIDILRNVWKNGFEFVKENKEYFQYTEQFSNSPYLELVDYEKIDRQFSPFYDVIKKGIERKIIKDVPFDILAVFMFYPILLLSNAKHCKNIELNEENINTAFQLAWDAIKL